MSRSSSSHMYFNLFFYLSSIYRHLYSSLYLAFHSFSLSLISSCNFYLRSLSFSLYCSLSYLSSFHLSSIYLKFSALCLFMRAIYSCNILISLFFTSLLLVNLIICWLRNPTLAWYSLVILYFSV